MFPVYLLLKYSSASTDDFHSFINLPFSSVCITDLLFASIDLCLPDKLVFKWTPLPPGLIFVRLLKLFIQKLSLSSHFSTGMFSSNNSIIGIFPLLIQFLNQLYTWLNVFLFNASCLCWLNLVLNVDLVNPIYFISLRS